MLTLTIIESFLTFQTREFSKAGAFRGNSPADVVQSCDITFTCVSDSVAVRDVSNFLLSSYNR